MVHRGDDMIGTYSKKGLIIGVSFLFLALLFPKVASAIEMERISGKDRIQTAVEVAKKGWPNGSDVVVLARANDFPDALAGTPLAYQENAPILLTSSTYISSKTAQEIARLGASKVIILGGKGAISNSVEQHLNEEMDLAVQRISGQDRYETAANIAKELDAYDTAVVASGEDFPDALSISAYAAREGYPILLTTKGKLPSVSQKLVNETSKNYLIGGEGVISASVENAISSSKRVSGSDRFETSRAVADEFGREDADQLYVATGFDFADALAGSVLAAKTNDPLMLIEKNYVPNATKLFIDENGVKSFRILGGTGAIDQYVGTELSLPIQLLLVNKQRGIPADYVPNIREPDVPFPFREDHEKRNMNAIAVPHLEELFQAAEKAGLDLYAQSGYRSYARQKAIHDRLVEQYGEAYANRVSAKPGHSEHQTGLAMDVTSPDVNYGLVEAFANTEEGRWVAQHAHEYGFIIRYPEEKESVTGYKYEPWHLRYVGETIASYMKDNERVLEEYLR